MSDDLVWYAAYGSNLLEERFLYYIEGGKLPDTGIRHDGARDATPPRDDRALLLPHRLFFARKARAWQGGGVAFIDPRRKDGVQTWGRAWLISRAQFEDVVRQENRASACSIDWPGLLETGEQDVCDGWYARVLLLEREREGHPVVTCTTPDHELIGQTRAPGEAYLGCIAAGLYECYHLGRKGMVDYLAALPGVKGHVSKGALGRLWQEVIDTFEPPEAPPEDGADTDAGDDEECDPGCDAGHGSGPDPAIN